MVLVVLGATPGGKTWFPNVYVIIFIWSVDQQLMNTDFDYLHPHFDKEPCFWGGITSGFTYLLIVDENDDNITVWQSRYYRQFLMLFWGVHLGAIFYKQGFKSNAPNALE